MIPAQVHMLAEVTALLAALGVGSILTKLVEGIVGAVTGRHDREATRVRHIMEDRDRAESERDEADKCRRIITEHAHRLRLHLIRVGENPEPFPTCPKAPPKDTP